MSTYDHKIIEKTWGDRWHKDEIYQPDMDKEKKPYYNLMMFPYPSAEGLHVGNMYAFVGSDIWGRFMNMQGYDVFEPMGLDGFGIHSENYAIQIGEHIRDVSKRTEKHFYEQLQMIGNRFDWSRRVETYKADYYKWTQWLFLQMYKNGLAYRKKSDVKWCPSCKTGLADEQVENGICERCKTEVGTKEMEQWFWRITDYAEKLLKNLEWINWSEEVKVGQKNWIGKSEGVNFKHRVKDLDIEFEVYDSIPQTCFAQTFIVVAPEHKIIDKLVAGTEREVEAKKFVEEIKKKKLAKKFDTDKALEGIFTGRYVENYLGTGEDLPIWVASFALVDYGTGIIGSSAHDERDFKFAKKYGIPLKPVLFPKDKKHASKVKKLEVFYREPDGILEEPKVFKGMRWDEVREPIMQHIEKKGWGRRAVNYKLRDWCISRQRYWGAPIPMIFCEKCNWQPVEEKDLPVELPDIPEFKDVLPDGSGKGPLARQESYVHTACPKCGGKARRETDIMDPFVDSSWYFFRYTSTEMDDVPFDEMRTKKWLPVNMYIGGKEHTVLHLLYSRFVTMALKEFGYIDFEEPYDRFYGHGLLIKDGAKMSKSKGNVINPDEYIAKYGADSMRMYLMFLGNFEQGGDWRDTGMKGMHKFVKRIHRVSMKIINAVISGELEIKDGTSRSIHSCIHKITKDIKRLSYNTAIAQLMIFFNGKEGRPDWRCKIDSEGSFEKVNRIGLAVDMKAFSKFLLVLSPFAPYLSEELWRKLGKKYSIHQMKWPEYDEKSITSDKVTVAVQINGKLRDTIELQKGTPERKVLETALRSEKIKKHLIDGKYKKKIYVKDRILSFVK